MKIFSFFLIVGLLLAAPIYAQDTKAIAEQEAAFKETLHTRAQKIVEKLSVSDEEKKELLTNIIATQYFDLNKIHDAHNALVKEIKSDNNKGKDAVQNIIKESETARDARLKELHADYIASLSKYLSSQQIDRVKDGMTYGVVHITNKAYQDMLPNLTKEQKAKILDWLVEAREHAMDAGSSKDKHAWFGKYKGRINNYLSAEGYDLNQAGKDWEKRRNAAKQSS